MRLNCSIMSVSDMVRSSGVERDVIGLSVGFETSEWIEFSTDGATLALQKADKPHTDQ